MRIAFLLPATCSSKSKIAPKKKFKKKELKQERRCFFGSRSHFFFVAGRKYDDVKQRSIGACKRSRHPHDWLNPSAKGLSTYEKVY